jgi:LmbE family N-acetylglucosaminyl deacetylase
VTAVRSAAGGGAESADTERSFDHRDPGNPPQAWSELRRSLPVRELPPTDTPIVLLAAHPDDETLGCGGILARAAVSGQPVTVIIATHGEASHPESPTHTPAMLAEIRRAEAARAVATLHPAARLVQLGLPDGRLAEHGGELSAALRSAIAGYRTDAVWILAPWEQDRHPDHAACSRAARRAAGAVTGATVAEYPIWAWHWVNPAGDDLPVAAMTRIPVGADAAHRRRQALACYRSQVLPLSARPGDEPVLGPQVIAHFDHDHDVLIDPRGTAAGTGYFAGLFAESDDPWGMGNRWYEQRKRALLLASLPRRRFAAAFEPGCAAGHLTVELARRCDTVLAVDIAARAVELTGAATAGLPGVSVRRMRVPDQWPHGSFDLIVLSEIGYYAADPAALADRLPRSLRPDGVVLLCHWRHPAIEHPQTAETVHATVRSRSGLHLLAEHREQDFLLDVLSADGISVARADGIVE